MLFEAVGPEDPKERGPKPVVQDRGTSSGVHSISQDQRRELLHLRLRTA